MVISKLTNIENVRHEYLYRIMPLKHVVDLFSTKELHFASPFSWDDPYERVLRYPGSRLVYAQCWCKKAVSDAMWRVYSPQHTSLRIRTTKGNLFNVGARVKATSSDKFRLDEVSYINPKKLDAMLEVIADELIESFSHERAIDALFFKRSAFDFENEVRAIVYLESQKNKLGKKALRVSIDPHSFIDSIMFDPRADPEYIKVVTFYLRKSVFFSGSIQRSSLYEERVIEI